ncbi:MAG TPA: GFA family protein [Polyangiaceae bacterium]|jgi:hypothetical protein
MTENDQTTSTQSHVRKHTGGCHCGAVRFEAVLDASAGSRCNCSVCTKLAQLGVIVKPAELVLTRGEDSLSFYEWGTKSGRRFFCKHCGISCFGRGHIPEIGGDYASVNLNCLDDFDPAEVKVTYWDGRHDNWQAGARDKPWPVRPSGNA